MFLVVGSEKIVPPGIVGWVFIKSSQLRSYQMLQDKLRMKYLRGVKKIFAALAAFGKLSSLIMFPSLEVTRRTFARKDMFLYLISVWIRDGTVGVMMMVMMMMVMMVMVVNRILWDKITWVPRYEITPTSSSFSHKNEGFHHIHLGQLPQVSPKIGECHGDLAAPLNIAPAQTLSIVLFPVAGFVNPWCLCTLLQHRNG